MTKDKTAILIVDDSPDTREMIRRHLSLHYPVVLTAGNVDDAIEVLQNQEFQLVITDLKMPGASGLELVQYVRENFHNTGLMMVTGYATIEGAVEAMKQGVGEYLPKPFTGEELLSLVDKEIKKVKKRQSLESETAASGKYGLIGCSEPLQEIFRVIEKASRTSATVLITGESGTGKELVTRAIHYQSKRSSAPFVPINCTAIPQELLESELFGYVKGAFTGAETSRAGFFQTADGGTIFLDEIAEMSLMMQSKLLRVIQEKEVYMVGSRKPAAVNVRIISATNKNLRNQVEAGLFREDLYYRLNVINIELPPLRKRGNDILLLINHFLRKHSLDMGTKLPALPENTLNLLQNYPWPGNVRELDNLIQRLVVMHNGESIKPADLPEYMKKTSNMPQNSLQRTLAEMENDYIKKVLEQTGNNKSEAARILGIDRKTLRSKLD
ncbi:MAG: sigma-54 dependent transcriptional regulator [Candidatus Cloacimonetes bacterium]|nr:sigma-54 dependent transcriptional regulator [Candidatus Cloacimonadota bacterium]